MKLSTHFDLSEFTTSQYASRFGIPNEPSEDELGNLIKLANTLERVRTILGEKPILISSGYRSVAVNRGVGGSANSAHITGDAVDFTCPGYGTPISVCKKIAQHMAPLGIGQLIYEFNSWVHLGMTAVAPENQMLTINNNGIAKGFA